MKDEIKDTFEALQLLEQGEFQELGDELLPWAFPELRNLKPFGLTREGKTRRGVPDSFVGLTAGEATIAVEYTTQASDTAGKLGSDFRSVRGKSPAADRIFLCTNRAVEEADLTSLRDQARTAGVRLEIVDGARLAAILSRDRQDIRQRFLKIPIGAHTLASLLSTLSETIEIATRGRSSSVSDGRFLRRFRLDVLCFERVRRDPRGTTLLLGEGGEGKTSWSIDYARRFAVVQPTVWLHALDLVDKSVDPLSAAVSLAAYKSADPARLPELAALLLREKQHLLLFLDGADESRDYSYIERALRSFRKSAVGELTHVVLCSRTEAAQQLQDALSVFVPDLNSEQNVLRLGPLRDDERRKLLALLGASEAASRSIENHLSREQAGNPLFIEMALVLERVGNLDRSGPDLIARVADHFVADICGRLRENGRVPRPARVERFFISLAVQLSETGAAGVDEEQARDLAGDITSGENSVLSRALQTPLLSRTRAGISFGHALFLEHFAERALLDRPERILALAGTPQDAERVAKRVPITVETMPVLLALAQRQPVTACVIAARGSTDIAMVDIAFNTVDALLKSRFPSDVHRGIRLLKAIHTERARNAAVVWFSALSEEGRRAWVFAAAELFFELEVPGAAHVATLCFPFQSSWFEPATVRRIDALSLPFREALRQHARGQLEDGWGGTADRHRYINVLALLRDDFVIGYLKAELDRAPLDEAAHHALVFLNRQAAIAVYANSVEKTLAAYRAARDGGSGEDAIHRIWSAMIPRTSDLVMLPHDALVGFVSTLLDSADFDHVAVGVEWSRLLREGSLFTKCAQAIRRFPNSFMMASSSLGPLLSSLTEVEIRTLYENSDAQLRRDIVHYVGDVPRVGFTAFLVQRLAEKEHRFSAIQSLRRIGAVSAAPQLAPFLDDGDAHVRMMAARTLGSLRYVPAAKKLSEMLESVAASSGADGGDREYDLIDALGLMGGPVAIDALERHYPKSRLPGEVLVAVLRLGLDSGVAAAERLTDDPASWPLLVNAIAHIGGRFRMGEGLDGSGAPRQPHEPRILIRSVALLDRVVQVATTRLQNPVPFTDDILRAIAMFDMPDATAFLREVAARPPLPPQALRRGEHEVFLDPAVEARQVLFDRGDEQYASALLARELAFVFEARWLSEHEIRRLAEYPRESVRKGLHESIEQGRHVARAVMVLSYFLEPEDRPLLVKLEQSSDVAVADQAHQALTARTAKKSS